MMKKQLQRLGAMCLLLFVACAVMAQDNVVASWDWENDNPTGICESTNYQGVTADIPSDVEGVLMHVDATNGKLNCVGRNNAQFNQGTVLQVPVKSAKDVVTVKAYPGYASYSVGGVAATEALTEYNATAEDVSKGYVEVLSTGSCYLYSVKVTFVSSVQEKELYSTDFSDWGAYETAAEEKETVASWNTRYSHETLTFTVFNTQIGASNFNTGKFPNWTGGMLMAAKSDTPYIITSALASITKVHFMHGATGGKRGWKLWAKGDGDADWVLISDAVANPAAGCEVDATINRTNCQLKFTNITNSQNAYLMQLNIYGNVDMSKTPALGSFSFNGETYHAADIFEENAEGVQAATIEIPNASELPSESNPLTDIVFENGSLESAVTYETAGESVVVTIKVAANGDVMTYKATFVHKPYFTLTYYNTDGSVLDNTQKVEKDAKITNLRSSDGVTVSDGGKFRGWFAEADGGRKYTADDAVTSDVNLYAVVTDIETESTTERYTFNLTDRYFYDEDHEAFDAAGGEFHDTTHGWVFNDGGKIDLLVGGHAYIILNLCRYGNAGTITMTGTDGSKIGEVATPVSTDGQSRSFEYEGGAGKITLTFGGGAYLHKVTVANVEDAPVEKNAQGYYVVRAGDGGNLLTTLEIANATSSSDERTYVFVPDGTYDLGNAVLTPVSGNNISIIGQSMENTIIVNEAEQEGIGVSATFLVTGENTYFQDLTLKNAYDYYQPGFAGRAVVLQDKGSRTICKNVRMLSYQDTYYSNSNSQFYFETSDIHGTVDFICGGGDVFFNKCTLTVEPRKADGTGECTITAPSTDVAGGCKFGYVFSECTIDSKAEKFNYGRAWNDRPRCAYIGTTLLQPEKLNETRWTLGGMNVPADKFVEYNTVNESGDVISPDTYVATFTKDSKSNTYETILTAEEAAGFSIAKVSEAWGWTPAEYTAQKGMSLLKADGSKLTWDAVDGAVAYAVFRNGQFVSMTGTASYDITEGEASEYTVRAANAHGGFGAEASTTTSGVENAVADQNDIVSTAYYNIQGARVTASYKGVVVKVDTLKDGKQTATKIIK